MSQVREVVAVVGQLGTPIADYGSTDLYKGPFDATQVHPSSATTVKWIESY